VAARQRRGRDRVHACIAVSARGSVRKRYGDMPHLLAVCPCGRRRTRGSIPLTPAAELDRHGSLSSIVSTSMAAGPRARFVASSVGLGVIADRTPSVGAAARRSNCSRVHTLHLVEVHGAPV
jgi:hypothetical protein